MGTVVFAKGLQVVRIHLQSLNQKIKINIKENLLTKISTAGKVHLVYLLANIAKFKNRKEVLNTIFLLKCDGFIARLETQKSPAYARLHRY